jgi:hypothetical protein
MVVVISVIIHHHGSTLSLRPRLHYDATANTPLKIYYVSSIETVLCLHYNGVVCRSVLTTELYCVYTITEWVAVAY